ncbi:MAG: hypothetical protein IPG06_02345 [Haliea sp.]|nr:hypothetical protein [Haliea sp.]
MTGLVIIGLFGLFLPWIFSGVRLLHAYDFWGCCKPCCDSIALALFVGWLAYRVGPGCANELKERVSELDEIRLDDGLGDDTADYGRRVLPGVCAD